MLMHFGQLRAYGDGAKPEVIEVNKPGLSVLFNAWFSKRIISGRSITVVVTEAILVKRVGVIFILNLSLSLYKILFYQII